MADGGASVGLIGGDGVGRSGYPGPFGSILGEPADAEGRSRWWGTTQLAREGGAVATSGCHRNR